MLEEQAKLETVRPGRSLFVRKVRLGNTTNTTTATLQIVCVHGTSASEQQYHMLLESLHEIILADGETEVSIQCLLPDLMGCGQSPPAPNAKNAYSNEEIMADLLALMEQHGDPNLPLVIMGHSYACNVILPMLLESQKNPAFPNLTACIFLSSAVRCPENPNIDGGHWIMRSPFVPDMLLNYMQPSMTEQFVEMAVHPDHVALKEQVKHASNGNSMRTARAYHSNHKWYADLDRLSSSSDSSVNFDVPVLVVHGAEDVIIPLAAGKSLARALSSVSLSSSSSSGQSSSSSSANVVEFVTVERARHLVMMEQPEEVARAVWKFLRPLLGQA
jgi:pimeloyl-ACP methyl ester carboxylesterase